MLIRQLCEEDYAAVIGVLDAWWGGRHMTDMLPKLFFTHFADTSFAADHEATLVGFLVGFVSQSRPREGYIHFVGVSPDHRRAGVGARLYETFFDAARTHGCSTVSAVTSPVNQRSIAFHLGMGFTAQPGPAQVGGLPVWPDYDGPGEDRVRFIKQLSEMTPSVARTAADTACAPAHRMD